jgi:hypothetical protein
MKQRHIQSFLMVSAAFFAISAPTGARASQSPFEASPVRQIAQSRVQSVRTTTEKRRESKRSDDTIG